MSRIGSPQKGTKTINTLLLFLYFLCLFVALLHNESEALQRAVKLIQIERLAEIFIAAGFQSGFFHAVHVVSRDSDNGRMISVPFTLAEVLDRLQTIEHWHVQIDNKKTRTMTSSEFQRLLTIFSFENAIAFHFKGAL